MERRDRNEWRCRKELRGRRDRKELMGRRDRRKRGIGRNGVVGKNKG